MKKIGILLLALILIGAGVATVIFFNPFSKKSYAIDNVLPEGPLLFVSMTDVEKSLAKFGATKFWKGLSSLDYPGILEKSGAKSEDVQMFEDLLTQLSSPENKGLLSEFFGQEVAIAIYPAEFDSLSPEVLQAVTANIFFVTRLRPKAKFAEFVSRFLSRFSQDVAIVPVKYKNHTIMMATAKNANLSIGYVSFHDVLVFGVDEKAAKAAIDVATRSQKQLSEDPLYSKTESEFIPGAATVAYANFEKFVGFLKDHLMKLAGKSDDPSAQLYIEQFNRNFRQMQGFRSFGYSGTFQDFLQMKVDVHFDKAKLDPVVARIYSCPPGENRSLSFIPQDVIGYQWNNCYSLKDYWLQAKEEMTEAAKFSPAGGSPAEVIAQMEENLGLSIEDDIIPAFGQEFGGALADLTFTGPFPWPQMLFFAEAADKDKLEKVIAGVLGKNPMFQLQTEDYQATTIKSITVPLLVVTLEPAYVYVGNYLVLSTEKDLLKKAIDTTRSSSSLGQNQKLQEIGFDIYQSANASFFLDLEKLAQKLEGLADWADAWSGKEQSKREAFKVGGAKRLADLESEIKAQEQYISGLIERVQATQGAPVSDSDSSATAVALDSEIALKQKDLDANREKAAELKVTIEQYNRPVTSQRDKELMENFVRPVIKTFQFWKVLGATTQLKENYIESMIKLKVE